MSKLLELQLAKQSLRQFITKLSAFRAHHIALGEPTPKSKNLSELAVWRFFIDSLPNFHLSRDSKNNFHKRAQLRTSSILSSAFG